jgi:hypothetical protein
MTKLSRRWRWILGPLFVAGVFFVWLYLTRPQTGEWKRVEGAAPVARHAQTASQGSRPPWLGAQTPPDMRDAGVSDLSEPAAQLAQWKKRLARANEVLDNYRRTTRYPHESRPAAEHGDQMNPNAPIVEDKRLHRPGEPVSGKVYLRTSQERIFVVGEESVRFTLMAYDETNAALPMTISGAGLFDPPMAGQPSRRPRKPVAFVPTPDGGLTAVVIPAKEGFADFTGQLRLDMTLEVQGETAQRGYTYFDVYFTPDPPALWLGQVREAVEQGSLNLYLKADVRKPGRYVVTGRIDDFTGKPFALAVFNDELNKGTQDIRLHLFGLLILDNAPAFPLRLRDVDGFLLHEDQFPDRSLMPRLPGLVHQTKRYALSDFSPSEWTSEERTRYLTEYQKDVEAARRRIEELEKLIRKPG